MPARIRRTVLFGARLLDGRSPDSIVDGILVIDETGRIVAAGSARSTTVPEDADRIDLSGLTLLPGIIDCHVHLASMKLQPVHDQVQRSATDVVVRALQTGREFLENGVTSVRADRWPRRRLDAFRGSHRHRDERPAARHRRRSGRSSPRHAPADPGRCGLDQGHGYGRSPLRSRHPRRFPIHRGGNPRHRRGGQGGRHQRDSRARRRNGRHQECPACRDHQHRARRSHRRRGNRLDARTRRAPRAYVQRQLRADGRREDCSWRSAALGDREDALPLRATAAQLPPCGRTRRARRHGHR